MIEDHDSDGAATARRDAVAALTRIGPIRPEAVLSAAKRGAAAPVDLAPEEIRAVCRMLLVQFAQMGIG